MKSRLHQLSALGQSVWIDYLSRDLIESGALARAVDGDAVVGVTSNPSIFQKALAHGHAYDEQIAASTEGDAESIFLSLALHDVAAACDLLRPVWERTESVDGYVSIEVEPTLAADTGATIAQATRFHEAIARPKTVEWTLTRVYRKLGARSRTRHRVRVESDHRHAEASRF
jgi:transaldolase